MALLTMKRGSPPPKPARRPPSFFNSPLSAPLPLVSGQDPVSKCLLRSIPFFLSPPISLRSSLPRPALFGRCNILHTISRAFGSLALCCLHRLFFSPGKSFPPFFAGWPPPPFYSFRGMPARRPGHLKLGLLLNPIRNLVLILFFQFFFFIFFSFLGDLTLALFPLIEQRSFPHSFSFSDWIMFFSSETDEIVSRTAPFLPPIPGPEGLF